MPGKRTIVDFFPELIGDSPYPDVLWNLAQVLEIDPRVLFIHNEPGILEIFEIRYP